MFRSSSRMQLVANSLRYRKGDENVTKGVNRGNRKEFWKMWKTKFFSPKVTDDPSPSKWFTSNRIRALAKSYEKMANTNRLTVNFEPKDQAEYAKFMMENQYHAVG